MPEIFSIEGEYVRVAYNNEGFMSLGYRVANQSVGSEWILLEVGMTLPASSRTFPVCASC